MNNENHILVLDIETTAFKPKDGHIVEIGIVELNLETGQTATVWDARCQEHGMVWAKAKDAWIFKNTTLSPMEVAASVFLGEQQPYIQTILDRYPLGCTAYNNQFDFGWMKSRGFTFPRELACPMKLSTNIVKAKHKNGRSGYKWPNVQEAWDFFFGKKTGYVETHRGADDAAHEALIVHKLYELGVFKV